ncbi:potassium transporter TrkG [Jannaschia donghaensis]|uniref:Ktr system potassium uptake protein B n=1 Tax=Jannaschia donghaensis TaxID=420998 RepID=A0A0M6YFD3_9RHOB|nr:potassium transporter TrkG [Jannaschia donghaensis]CTQ48223.1 Ktr system potassium uptake protein B [Jannaschia donghaensis]
MITFGVLALGLLNGGANSSLFRADLPVLAGNTPLSLALRVLAFAGSVQALGVLALAPGLMRDSGWAGLWHAVFQSGSAFNNAGFTIIGGVAGAPAALLVVTAALFVVGGLCFAAISNLRGRILGRDALHLHTRVVLVGTALLIVLGWAGFALIEWSNPRTLGTHREGARAGLPLFQALTPRTAGFDGVGVDGLTGGGQALTIVLMLIGAGATSTGGGLKVGTVLLLIVAIGISARRGGPLHAGKWRIPAQSLLRIAQLVGVALVLVFVATLVIWGLGDHTFADTLFEASSAFGTVGLTSGVTQAASGTERAILCLLMFLGRIGPLTLAWLLAARFIGPPDTDETTLPVS